MARCAEQPQILCRVFPLNYILVNLSFIKIQMLYMPMQPTICHQPEEALLKVFIIKYALYCQPSYSFIFSQLNPSYPCLVYIMSRSSHHSQPLPQQDDPLEQDYNAPLSIKLLILYLYFIQGLVSSLAGTVIYIYPELPDYTTLSVFTLSNLPYSLKFLSAPVVEKYTNFSYGKRKTWVITSQLLTFILLLVSSFYTEQKQAYTFAIILIIANYAMTLQDISLDGLCLKEVRSHNMMSRLQSGGQTVGIILGGLGFLKLTSVQFAAYFGLKSAITNLQVLLIALAILILIPCILMHFLFQETYLEVEREAASKPLLKIYQIYRYFLFPSYRYFRIFMFMVFFYQGINFFIAGYNVELIKKGFSRDTMNTIDNLNIIFQLLAIYFFGHLATYWGIARSLQINLGLTILTFLYLLIWFPVALVPIIITSFLIGLFQQWQNLISTQICTFFPQVGLSGMIYTGNSSGYNLGKMTTVQTRLLNYWSWRGWAIFGIGLQSLIILAIPWAFGMIQDGETEIVELDTNEEGEDIPKAKIQDEIPKEN